MIDEYLNEKAFILIKGEKDLNNKIEYIKKIDNDDELYQSLLKENIFNYNFINFAKKYHEERKNFLYSIFIQGKIKSKRRDDN